MILSPLLKELFHVNVSDVTMAVLNTRVRRRVFNSRFNLRYYGLYNIQLNFTAGLWNTFITKSLVYVNSVWGEYTLIQIHNTLMGNKSVI